MVVVLLCMTQEKKKPPYSGKLDYLDSYIFLFNWYLSYMKYLITESQINNLTSLYLDSQGFAQTEKDDKIYFKKCESFCYSRA